MFADVVDDGGYLEASIDHAEGPGQPDVRRMLVPIGPVGIFGASNFPFAFSVLGGDTASAIAAGCAVVIKAHPAHPLTSQLSGEILRDAVADDAPDSVQLVHGFEAGLALVRDSSIRAVTLTGSIAAARSIQSAINEREDPIPFFAELGSVNPLVVLPGAARARAAEIARELTESFTGSGGQLCTKPGFVFVPEGADGDELADSLHAAVARLEPATLLSSGIRDAFETAVTPLTLLGTRTTQAQSRPPGSPESTGFEVRPTVVEMKLMGLSAEAIHECFGPALMMVRYDSEQAISDALATFPPSLTFTLHLEPSDQAAARQLVELMADRSGRIVFDGYPTGVRVSWAQHHGGPWPSTNSQHTSVGATAIRRFLRPLAFQNAPSWVLPPELVDDSPGIPRRVDGKLEIH